jgi:hypothetical protein
MSSVSIPATVDFIRKVRTYVRRMAASLAARASHVRMDTRVSGMVRAVSVKMAKLRLHRCVTVQFAHLGRPGLLGNAPRATKGVARIQREPAASVVRLVGPAATVSSAPSVQWDHLLQMASSATTLSQGIGRMPIDRGRSCVLQIQVVLAGSASPAVREKLATPYALSAPPVLADATSLAVKGASLATRAQYPTMRLVQLSVSAVPSRGPQQLQAHAMRM